MRKKKFIKGLLMVSTTVAVCFGASVVEASAADANQIEPSNVTIDYANQKLMVSASGDTEIIFGVSTVKANKKVGGYVINTSSWDVYENAGNGVTIDLSSLNRLKDNYVQIMGELNSEPLTIKIPAVNKDLKANFDSLTGKVSVTNKKKQPADLPNGAEFEYRTQYSDWQSYELTDVLKMYQQRGATLYFRIKASETKRLDTYSQTEILKDADGNSVEVKTVDSFPGMELKVAVSKLANAPKISINYVNRTMKVPKGILYRIVLPSNGKTYTNGWKESDGKTITYDYGKEAGGYNFGFETLVSSGGIVEVKTKATDKKPESKIRRVITVGTKDHMEGCNGWQMTGTTSSVIYDSFGVYREDYLNAIGDLKYCVKVALEKVVTKGKTTYTMTLTNNSTEVYQLIALDTSVPTDNAKAKTIAAAKELGQTKVTKITGLKEGQYIFVRFPSSNKNTGVWSSDYTKIGQIG